jgi:hypothetical protein
MVNPKDQDESTFKIIVGEYFDDPKYLLAYAFHKREVIKETEKFTPQERPKKRATLKHTLLTDDRKADNLDKADKVLKKGVFNYIVDNPYECLTMTVEPFLTQTVIGPNIDAVANEGIEKIQTVANEFVSCIEDYKGDLKKGNSLVYIFITNFFASILVAFAFLLFSIVLSKESQRNKAIKIANIILPEGAYVIDSFKLSKNK